MELVAQSIAENTVGQNEGRLRTMSDEIKTLCDMVEQYKASCNTESGIRRRMEEITEILENEPENGGGYNDRLVRQLIGTIKVMSEDRLEITFVCGLTYEQTIAPKVRKLSRAS